jgi:hypothetical protein
MADNPLLRNSFARRAGNRTPKSLPAVEMPVCSILLISGGKGSKGR